MNLIKLNTSLWSISYFLCLVDMNLSTLLGLILLSTHLLFFSTTWPNISLWPRLGETSNPRTKCSIIHGWLFVRVLAQFAHTILTTGCYRGTNSLTAWSRDTWPTQSSKVYSRAQNKKSRMVGRVSEQCTLWSVFCAVCADINCTAAWPTIHAFVLTNDQLGWFLSDQTPLFCALL